MCRSGSYDGRARVPSCHPCEPSNASAPRGASGRPPRGLFRVDLADRSPDAPRRDRRCDLLQRDEVLPTSAEERPEVRPEDLYALVTRPFVERDLGLDAHEREQVAQHADTRFEILEKGRRGFFAL